MTSWHLKKKKWHLPVGKLALSVKVHFLTDFKKTTKSGFCSCDSLKSKQQSQLAVVDSVKNQSRNLENKAEEKVCNTRSKTKQQPEFAVVDRMTRAKCKQQE